MLALLVLAGVIATPARAAEPIQPLFVDLGAETVEERAKAIAEPLPDGRVLIAGGSETLTSRTAEIFDFDELSFEPAPHLTRHIRREAMGAPLHDGRVLIAGGFNEIAYDNAEIFNPISEEFTDAKGEMTTTRSNGVAATLPDGRVLIAGGTSEGQTLKSAEIFDPSSEEFTAVDSEMQVGRSGAVAASLPSGEVLITGGEGKASRDSAEIFDPATQSFGVLSPDTGNEGAAAAGVALPNGQVLLAGGTSGNIPQRWAGLVDPATGAVAYLPKEGGTQLTTERWNATAARLSNGLVLISGGAWRHEAERSAELFAPAPALGASGNQLGPHTLGEDPPPATVTVTSLGGRKLDIDSISLVGPDAADFRILDDSCTGAELYFEESCSLSVQFARTRLGDSEARLVFDDNEPVPTDVKLSGSVVAPAVLADALTAQRPLDALTPQKPGRKAISSRCTARPAGRSRQVKVICRVAPAPGAWEARLRRGGRIVSRRQLTAVPKRLKFEQPGGGHGGFRLELVPLPS